MPTLQRAVAVAENRDVAVAVAERLHLDVPGPHQAALHEQSRIAELGLGQALHGHEAGFELAAVVAAMHADAATAGGTLQHHRVADRLG